MPFSSPVNNIEGKLSRLTIVFDALYISTLCLLTIIVASAWISSRIQRTSTWFMFMISLMLACIANLALLGHQAGKPPPFAICLTQAIMIDAVPVLYVFYATTLVIQAYISVLAAFRSDTARLRNRVILFHVGPWVAFVAIIIVNLVFGLAHPTKAKRYELAAGVYCHFSDPLPKKISAGFILCSVVMFSLVEIFLCRKMYLVWKDIGGLSRVKQRVQSGTFIRTVLISIVISIAGIWISSVQYIASTRPPSAYTMPLIITQACVPLAVAVCVASQVEFLRHWMFWRKDTHANANMPAEAGQPPVIDSQEEWERHATGSSL